MAKKKIWRTNKYSNTEDWFRITKLLQKDSQRSISLQENNIFTSFILIQKLLM